MQDNLSSWMFAIPATILARLGLFLRSAASDLAIAIFGAGLMGFGVLFDFWLIKADFDGRQAAIDRGREL